MAEPYKSVFSVGLTPPDFAPLDGSRNTDVLIIGGGISGILTARALKARGVDCLLVEAGKICDGVTGNTTAKVTFCHGLIYDKLIREQGREVAGLYLEAQMSALAEYRRLAEEIPCDFEDAVSYVYSRRSREPLYSEAEALISLGIPADVVDMPDLPLKTLGAVRVMAQAQMNPLKLLYGISQGLPICENTRVTELAPHVARTDRGDIHFRQAIIATHFPILNKHGGYFLKMYQHRSYVIALDGVDKMPDGIIIDEDERGLSFRTYGSCLLLGGGSHRTGKQGGGWRELEAFAREHYPEAEVTARWATQDCMTLDGVPYIGEYSKSTEDLYVSTGFNKWGMTSSLVAANLLADLIIGKDNPYTGVFSPSRSIWKPKLAVNAAEAILNLLTPTAPRCPHLGCALKYNAAEHSWDCPCHGSRFSEDGELINNPATDGIKPPKQKNADK